MIKDIKREIKDEIRKVKEYKWRLNNYYYNRSQYDSWWNLYSDNRYNYYSSFNNRAYYKYDADQQKFIPHWVNPDLKPQKEGYIYIR